MYVCMCVCWSDVCLCVCWSDPCLCVCWSDVCVYVGVMCVCVCNCICIPKDAVCCIISNIVILTMLFMSRDAKPRDHNINA